MITSASHRPWPGDTSPTDLKSAGLTTPSLVRVKIFTLDNRFIARWIGVLDHPERSRAGESVPGGSGRRHADHLDPALPGR